MLKGILRVYTKTRATILDRPVELAILNAQIERFETELMAAEARHALEIGDRAGVQHYVLALHQRRGGAVLGLASMMARWAPGLLRSRPARDGWDFTKPDPIRLFSCIELC